MGLPIARDQRFRGLGVDSDVLAHSLLSVDKDVGAFPTRAIAELALKLPRENRTDGGVVEVKPALYEPLL